MKGNKKSYELPLEDSPYRLDEHGPLFVCGCPRSGTTFLSKAIGGVTQIEEFTGVLAPPRLMHLIGFHAARGNHEYVSELLHLMRDVFWQAFWRRILSHPERAAQVVSRQKPPHWIFGNRQVTDQIFCYKEPFAAFAINEMVDYFPQAKVIHIVRDGRDVADSMIRSYPDALSDRILESYDLAMQKNSEIGIPRSAGHRFVPWWVPDSEAVNFLHASNYGRYIWMWKEIVARMQKCMQKLQPWRFLELHYESVVSNPIESAEKILEFVGFEMSSRLRRRLEKGRTGSIGIAKRNQSHERISEAFNIAGEFLDCYGYTKDKTNAR